MVRTVISLPAEDKAWLDAKAAETHRPMTEVVRDAVRRLREQDATAFDELLNQTRGLWKAGDGLKYQRRVRKEWR